MSNKWKDSADSDGLIMFPISCLSAVRAEQEKLLPPNISWATFPKCPEEETKSRSVHTEHKFCIVVKFVQFIEDGSPLIPEPSSLLTNCRCCRLLISVWEYPYRVWEYPYRVWECPHRVWEYPYRVWECPHIVWEYPHRVWECPHIVNKGTW